MFRLVPNPSPDFTKVSYYSSMLTGDHPGRLWGDTYIAVARYPQPPVNVKMEGNALRWEKPRYSAEIKGFNIYRSDNSGKGDYYRLNSRPVQDTRYALPADARKGFYTVTSVEHSGLESRAFSNEVAVDTDGPYRLFYQPLQGTLSSPMVPFFEPERASDSYAAAVVDPELIYKRDLAGGLKGSVNLHVEIPAPGVWRIMARVRGMFDIERSSYARGWPPSGRYSNGRFRVKAGNQYIGEISVDDFVWGWVELNAGSVEIESGTLELEFSTGDAGIAIDNILLTNDAHFVPAHRDNTPARPPSVPGGIEAEIRTEELEWNGYNIKPPYVKFTWEQSNAPHGVRYYNIYRSSDSEFSTDQSTLIGSSSEPLFIDPELAGGEYHYRVRAIDNWDNRSAAGDAIRIRIE